MHFQPVIGIFLPQLWVDFKEKFLRLILYGAGRRPLATSLLAGLLCGLQYYKKLAPLIYKLVRSTCSKSKLCSACMWLCIWICFKLIITFSIKLHFWYIIIENMSPTKMLKILLACFCDIIPMIHQSEDSQEAWYIDTSIISENKKILCNCCAVCLFFVLSPF